MHSGKGNGKGNGKGKVCEVVCNICNREFIWISLRNGNPMVCKDSPTPTHWSSVSPLLVNRASPTTYIIYSIGPTLSEATLSGATLSGATLFGATLSEGVIGIFQNEMESPLDERSALRMSAPRMFIQPTPKMCFSASKCVCTNVLGVNGRAELRS